MDRRRNRKGGTVNGRSAYFGRFGATSLLVGGPNQCGIQRFVPNCRPFASCRSVVLRNCAWQKNRCAREYIQDLLSGVAQVLAIQYWSLANVSMWQKTGFDLLRNVSLWILSFVIWKLFQRPIPVIQFRLWPVVRWWNLFDLCLFFNLLIQILHYKNYFDVGYFLTLRIQTWLIFGFVHLQTLGVFLVLVVDVLNIPRTEEFQPRC